MPSPKNIKRIDTGRTHGWQVVIQREGEEHSKLFSDKKYGGREKALERARAHRDALLKELPEIPENSGHLHTEAMRHKAWKQLTRTNVKGIGLTWQRSGDTRYPHVQAMWTDAGGTPRSRSRSISKHGLKSALWQVCSLLYEGRNRSGPEPWQLYEDALPAIERLLEYPPKQAA